MHEEEYHMMDYHMVDWAVNLFGSFWWSFMVLGWLFVIITSIIIAFYIHKDATSKRIVNSEIWLIIGLFLNVIGLLLYLLVRGNYGENEGRR